MKPYIQQTQQPAGDSASFIKTGGRFANACVFLKTMFLFCLALCVSGGAWGKETVTFSSLKEKARHGDINAQYYLGLIYTFGSEKAVEKNAPEIDETVDKDNERAAFWLDRAARSGIKGAQYLLGVHYGIGEKGEKDGDKALYWLEKSLNSGGKLQDTFASELISRLKKEGCSADDAKTCSECDGTGHLSRRPCDNPYCKNGTLVSSPITFMNGRPCGICSGTGYITPKCKECDGLGVPKIHSSIECSTCDGTGYLPRQRCTNPNCQNGMVKGPFGMAPCGTCFGTGYCTPKCKDCDGTGISDDD